MAAAKKTSQPKQTRQPKTKRSGAPTFKEAATAYYDAKAGTWRNQKTRLNWTQRAEKYLFPAIGDKAIDRITQPDVLNILGPIWSTKAETGRKVREELKAVFGWAQSYQYIQHNPAGPAINAALPAQPKVKEHFKALDYSQVSLAIRQVYASTAFPSTKMAFEFMVLTATRPGEVRGAVWSEINLDSALWVIPGTRMKGSREHRVPLSAQALGTCWPAPRPSGVQARISSPNDLTPHKPLSENALSVMLKRVGVDATAHGFRSSFRDWAAESTDANFAVMELALAHGVGSSTVQSYARSDLMERRRALMAEWGDFAVELN